MLDLPILKVLNKNSSNKMMIDNENKTKNAFQNTLGILVTCDHFYGTYYILKLGLFS